MLANAAVFPTRSSLLLLISQLRPAPSVGAARRLGAAFLPYVLCVFYANGREPLLEIGSFGAFRVHGYVGLQLFRILHTVSATLFGCLFSMPSPLTKEKKLIESPHAFGGVCTDSCSFAGSRTRYSSVSKKRAPAHSAIALFSSLTNVLVACALAFSFCEKNVFLFSRILARYFRDTEVAWIA